jgi:hypothetical protein
MINDGKTYDYNNRGKIQQERFLRNGLVDDYLSKKKNKDYYKRSIAKFPDVEIYFAKEDNLIYSLESTLGDDYIDISIRESSLSKIWSNKTEDEIKFAIECKRIKEPSDYLEYKKDIDKFIARPFTTFRLPFEGQIAFLEKTEINHSLAKDEINNRLKDSQYLVSELTFTQIEDNIDYSYTSKHKRNYQPFELFSIFHLFLDYSAIVINN